MKLNAIVVSEKDRWPNPWQVKGDSVLLDLTLVYERLCNVFGDLAAGRGRAWTVDRGERRQLVACSLPADEDLRLVREEGATAPGFVRDAVPLADLARRLCRIAEWAGIEKRRARGLVARLARAELATCAEYRGRVTGALELSLVRDTVAAQVADAEARAAEAEARAAEAEAEMYKAQSKGEAEAEARARAEAKRDEAEAARRDAEIALARLEERKAKTKGARGKNIPGDVKETVLEFVEMECGGDVRGEGWKEAFDRFASSPQYTVAVQKHVGSAPAMERIAEAARLEKKRREIGARRQKK